VAKEERRDASGEGGDPSGLLLPSPLQELAPHEPSKAWGKKKIGLKLRKNKKVENCGKKERMKPLRKFTENRGHGKGSAGKVYERRNVRKR